MKKPRIAILAEKYGGIGGSERFAKEVTERLAATGRYEFHVFANRWEAGRPDIAFHKIPSIKFPRFLRPWFFKVMAQRCIARGGFDLVHSHWPTFKADVFSVHTAPHAYWIKHVLKRRPNLFDRVMMRIDRRMIEGGGKSTFMPVSTFLQDRYTEVFGALPGDWKVVHPGVDVEKFARDPVARTEIRSRLGIQDDEFVILFVGMNFGPKGLGRLMEGFANFRRRETRVRARLVAIGRGPVAEFSAKASKLGIDREVIFVSPQATGIEHYYSAADAFALLSEFETFGMVVLEAMAAGLPVIVSDQMGVKDVVRKPGRIVPADASPEVIAKALQDLPLSRYADPAERNEDPEIRHGDWMGCIDQILRSYEDRLRDKRSHGAIP